MATYTIVDKDKDPTGPGEIHAGEHIQVSDGDIFIVDPSANANITFQSDGSGPADFEILFNSGNANSFDIKVEEDLIPSVDIANNADLTDVKFDGKAADGVEFSAGDNVSFGQFDGSQAGANVVTIGNGFSTSKNWKFGDGDDTFLIGDDTTFEDIDTGEGNDTIVIGDRARLDKVDTGEGDDDVTFGDDLVASDVKTDDGDDTVRSGQNAQANKFDGGNGNDTHNSETTGTNSENFESNTIVCFTRGMTIETINGPVAVENLKKGMLVETVDNGFQPILWMDAFCLDREALEAAPRLRPIRISSGSLGPNIPSSDFIVSRQHRVLLRSPIVRRMFGHAEIFVPALLLTELPGVDVLDPLQEVEYHHFLLNRHEVVLSHRVETESLFLGRQTLKTLNRQARLDIEALGESQVHRGDTESLARPCPKNRAKLRHLLQRHIRNDKYLQIPREDVQALKAG